MMDLYGPTQCKNGGDRGLCGDWYTMLVACSLDIATTIERME